MAHGPLSSGAARFWRQLSKYVRPTAMAKRSLRSLRGFDVLLWSVGTPPTGVVSMSSSREASSS